MSVLSCLVTDLLRANTLSVLAFIWRTNFARVDGVNVDGTLTGVDRKSLAFVVVDGFFLDAMFVTSVGPASKF